jgi:2-oxoisovalerate dehydrogenase E1 component
MIPFYWASVCAHIIACFNYWPKRDDPFSGGRTYYSHPSLNDDDKPKIPHQSSATGMQAIPTTGVAMGIKLKEIHGMDQVYGDDQPVVVCSIGDAAMTEGEIAEAMQMAALKQLPIIYLVQDNGWDISANEEETRAMNAAEYALGFKKIETRSIDGTVFSESFNTMKEVIDTVRKERRPFLVHAKVPLLNHHTSGVRMDMYRHDEEEVAEARSRDPYPKLIQELRDAGVSDDEIEALENEARAIVESDYQEALQAEEPRADELLDHYFAPTPVSLKKKECARTQGPRENRDGRLCAFRYQRVDAQTPGGIAVWARCGCTYRWRFPRSRNTCANLWR